MLSDFSFAEDTIGFIIEGDVDGKVMDNLVKGIRGTFVENEKISLYLEDLNIKSFSVKSIIRGSLVPFRYGNKFHKLALISDRKWIHFIGYFHNLLFRMKVRCFNTENRVMAMSWIMEK